MAELYKIGTLVEDLSDGRIPEPDGAGLNRLFLVGPSREGGLTILITNEDRRVKRVVTWAAVAAFRNLWRGIQEENRQQKGDDEVAQ